LKTKLLFLVIAFALMAGVHPVAGQNAQFFRISGPAATTITAFNPDGTLVWSNALAGTNYTIQTTPALPGGGTNWVDYDQVAVTNGSSTNQLVVFNPPDGMVFVPAGVFIMGDQLDGEGDARPTNVAVSAFFMDANLVSYDQWQSVYFYAKKAGYGFDDAGAGKDSDHPVQSVNWWDCLKWCNARSQQDGLTPVYYTDAAFTQIYTNGDLTPFVNWTNSGYRLPTEAEWEHAARGGLNGMRFPWGNIISQSLANYHGNTILDSYDLGPSGFNVLFNDGNPPFTSPVGYFAPNGYQLYDMAGNVFEWCWDWYGTPYPGGTDPQGATSGIYRVLRGGAWNGDPGNERCSGRAGDRPNAVQNYYGFRCVQGF
jgi:formylglycine-generating enzyme required for sulfatase activity